MNHVNGAAAASRANAREVPDRLLALTIEALAFISRERAEGMARQWLAGVPLSNGNEQSVLARSLALSVPSSLAGTTAFDRLARAMKGRPPEDAAAVTLLRRSRLRLARLSRERFEDLAIGEIRDLVGKCYFALSCGDRGDDEVTGSAVHSRKLDDSAQSPLR